MRNIILSCLFLPLLAALPFTLSAAPAGPVAPAAVSAERDVNTHGVLAKINLNEADAATLQQHLNGIGKAKAESIVAYREANGAFDSVDEMLEIKGIGKALLERNRDKLVVE
ncbi:ComEA family DNA-binding protein [Pseudomonas faucium]|uniref:ComEA family DNA-binding protein n=1 Tax=Pseudomonas faucium TaxID=2740518 RepID=UPI001F37356F|nr:ComEA family DNA-binding protein [Pseudomonas faucium]